MKLKMKSYIKPFEKVLAVMELRSLTGIEDIEISDTPEYIIDSDVPEEVLIDNLAYWETVGENPKKKTRQVLLENTYRGEESYRQLSLFSENEMNIRQTRLLRYGLHDIHEYRGKFFPQLVRACINISGIREGSIVLDPFCGSGTTLCEAKIRGMQSVGVDLNPLSVMISRVKTGILDADKNDISDAYTLIRKEIENVESDDSKRWDEADRKYLLGWFAEEALGDIDTVLCAIEKIDNECMRDLFKIHLSNILREVSWQKESDLRVRKAVGTYQKGDVIQKFFEEAGRQAVKAAAYLGAVKNLDKPECTVFEGNTVNIVRDAEAYVGRCDVIITSPPYATALPYLDTDRLSILVLGLMHRKNFPERNADMVGNREISEKKRKELWQAYENRKSELTQEIQDLIEKIAAENHKPETGFRRKNLPALLAKYFLDMLDAMKAANQMLKPGALAFYVVGNNSTMVAGKKVIIDTNILLWNLADKIGWHKEEYIDMDMLKVKLGYRNNPGTTEAILIFKKEVH